MQRSKMQRLPLVLVLLLAAAPAGISARRGRKGKEPAGKGGLDLGGTNKVPAEWAAALPEEATVQEKDWGLKKPEHNRCVPDLGGAPPASVALPIQLQHYADTTPVARRLKKLRTIPLRSSAVTGYAEMAQDLLDNGRISACKKVVAEGQAAVDGASSGYPQSVVSI